MTTPARGRAIASILAACCVSLGAQDLDEQRSAWAYKRRVVIRQEGQRLISVAVPPDVLARARPGGADLRLVQSDGREVAYVVDRARGGAAEARYQGKLIDSSQQARVSSSWTVDLGAERAFEALLLQVPEQDFAKRVQVLVSGDAVTWRALRQDAGIFDRAWSGRIHHTRIEVEPTSARYVRIDADDHRSRPISVMGVEAVHSARSASARWTREARLLPIEAASGLSRFRVEVLPGLPFEEVSLDPEEAVFMRHARLLGQHERNGKTVEEVLGEGDVYRVRADDAFAPTASLTFPVRGTSQPAPSTTGELILEVRNGDNPPLRGLRVRVAAPETRLVFPAAGAPLVLYYGNARARAPLYDLESLRAQIFPSERLPHGELLGEEPNGSFRQAPPLDFTASRGAPLDAGKWPRERSFAVAGPDDLYTIVLAPLDVSLLRPDLADLRVVDAESRQVPFVSEKAAREERVALRLTSVAARSSAGRSEGAVSRYRLSLPDPLRRPIPIQAVEVAVRESFFTRGSRLLTPDPQGRGGERVLYSGTFAREERQQAGRTPLRVSLDDRRVSELLLEIDEGDNAPLTIEGVTALVAVPRIAFKTGPGRYRLLMGNEEAKAPQYDLASLRREVLAYSAVPLTAEPADVNPAHRRSVADLFRQAPPTLLLWGTLVGAVVVLFLLTARTLRTPPSP